jgi:hypothetical protein
MVDGHAHHGGFLVHPVLAYFSLVHLINALDCTERLPIIYRSQRLRPMRFCTSFLSEMSERDQEGNEMCRQLSSSTSYAAVGK